MANNSYESRRMVLRTIDAMFYIAGGLGTIFSAVLGLFFIFGGTLNLGWFRLATISNLAAAIVFIFAFLIYYSKLVGKRTAQEESALRYAGCPTWMKFACAASVVLGLIVFFSSRLLQLFNILPIEYENTLPPNVSAGFGLIVYAACTAQLYSARHSE
jgi:hypothetical protein